MPSHSFKIFLSFCLSSFIIQLSSATLWASQNSFEPVVQTRYGQIRGIRVPTRAGQLDTHFTQYIGVPYAQPPIGVNRFSVSNQTFHILIGERKIIINHFF